MHFGSSLGGMQSSVPGKSLERKQQLQSLRVLQVVLAPWINLQEDISRNEIPPKEDELEAELIPLTVYHPVIPTLIHMRFK